MMFLTLEGLYGMELPNLKEIQEAVVTAFKTCAEEEKLEIKL